MAPVQPHSAQRKARTCESCHDNPKALGYGIAGGVFQTRYVEDVVEDLIDQKSGKPIPKPGNYKIQIPKIADLDFDWSTIIKDGQQVQTVGTHWPLSRSLPKEMRDGMERTGLCMGCHREMSNEELWGKVATPGIKPVAIFASIFGLLALQVSFQTLQASDSSDQAKHATPAQLVAASKGVKRIRHIDPLDEGRANATHRGKNPHGKLTADQEINVALQHYQEGRKPQAMVVLSQAIKKYPNNAKLLDVRATLELQSGKTKEALSDIEKAVQIEPNNAIYLVNRSQVYLKFHREAEALKDLDKAIEINADLIPARFNRGSLLAYQGKNEAAVKDFDQTSLLEPEYVMPYEKRILSDDGELEVRYAIRPLNRIEIAYDDPHNSAPHPNDLFEMLFRTLTETLAGGTHVISRAYTVDQAKEYFNAGWAFCWGV
ncbi:DnaJ subfamily C member 3 [Nymphon striatum]|nr:DnaJ subfamily C member 3 [Nymphon striatum]